MAEFEFDVPAGWGGSIPSGPRSHDMHLEIEEWFRVPHAALLERARKSTGSAAAAGTPVPTKSPTVHRDVRKGTTVTSASTSRVNSSKIVVVGPKNSDAKQTKAAKPSNGSKRAEDAENSHLLALLAEHNKKFRKTTYEPRQHNVRDVRRVRLIVVL
jgi:hypothetical protein